MAHYAKVKNGIVEQVIVAEADYIDGLEDSSSWVQTSYNTCNGLHLGGGTPLRRNFAGVGMVYDEVRDAFYDPQRYSSWTFNEETFDWEPPIPYPDDWFPADYDWDEETLSWVKVPVAP